LENVEEFKDFIVLEEALERRTGEDAGGPMKDNAGLSIRFW
jgi:hypothetical protein